MEPDATGKPLIQNRIDDVESFYHLAFWLALKYTTHKLSSATLTSVLRQNFDALYRDEGGEACIGTARLGDIISGAVASKASFTNKGIRTILRKMRYTLKERYTDPAIDFEDDEKLQDPRKMAEVQKAKGLKALEDTKWLPNLLDDILEDPTINWDTNGARVRHVLQKFPRYLQRILKRKTESSLHSEGSRKAPRKSAKSTPQDNRSVPE